MMLRLSTTTTLLARRHCIPLATAVTTSTCTSQQHFGAWTKAKKKRQARWERNQALQAANRVPPTPPFYMSRDTPVQNAIDATSQRLEIQQHDATVVEDMRRTLQSPAFSAAPTLRHHMNYTQMSDRVRKLFDLTNGNQREVVQAQKQRGMHVFAVRPGDTGSSAVQVIALTTRIQQLQTHMGMHKKDKHSKRGMDALLIRRRKVLDYMERKEFEAYRRVVKTLGLQRK